MGRVHKYKRTGHNKRLVSSEIVHQRHKIKRSGRIVASDERTWDGIKKSTDDERGWWDKLRDEYREDEEQNRPSNVHKFRGSY